MDRRADFAHRNRELMCKIRIVEIAAHNPVDFHERLETDEEFRKAVEDLHGKTLACYCKTDACHGDVIIEYLQQSDKERVQS